MEVYQPLSRDRREFRLVRIAPGKQDAPVGLTLEHFSLDHLPSYAALSYVWGEEKFVDVRVNGTTTSIRENLREALLQIRSSNMGFSTSLWIDAICINQNDDAERSWQVNEMRTIFSQASLVYSWLGPAADGSDAVIELLYSVGRQVLEAGYDKTQLTGLKHKAWWTHKRRWRKHDVFVSPSPWVLDQRSQDYAFLLKLWQSPELRSDQASKALAPLLHREYFCRVWIIQELALAKRGVILCGNSSLPLETFDAGLVGIDLCMASESLVRNLSYEDKSWFSYSGTYFYLKPFEVRRAISSGSPPRMGEILQVYYSAPGRPLYMASDPRDVVFGLLGCAADTATLNIQADYTQTVAQVYAKLTKALLNHCPDYPLGYCLFPKDIAGLPSWVPDWKLKGESGIGVYPVGYNRHFEASRGLDQSSEQTQRSDWNVLRRQGCRVDAVTAVVEPVARFSGRYSVSVKDLGRWLKEIVQFCELHTSSGHPEDAVWYAVVRGSYARGTSSSAWPSLASKVFRGEPLKLEDLTPEQTECIKSCTPDLDLEEFTRQLMSEATVSGRART